MGSPWDQAESEESDVPSTNTSTPARLPVVGLEASELELLRSAPDFDAEEMSTVRPPGGWPTPAPPPAAGFKPAGPVWSPPNRIEPPTAWAPPGHHMEPEVVPESATARPIEPPTPAAAPAAQPVQPAPAPWRPPNRVDPPAPAWSPGARVGGAAASADSGPDASPNRFPEERTVALLAEDLLGRPLDEVLPVPIVEEQPVKQEPTWAPVRAAAPAPERAKTGRKAPDVNVWDQAMPLVSEG